MPSAISLANKRESEIDFDSHATCQTIMSAVASAVPSLPTYDVLKQDLGSGFQQAKGGLEGLGKSLIQYQFLTQTLSNLRADGNAIQDRLEQSATESAQRAAANSAHLDATIQTIKGESEGIYGSPEYGYFQAGVLEPNAVPVYHQSTRGA